MTELGSESMPDSTIENPKIRNYKLNVVLWSTYDIANTIFSMGIVSMSILQMSELLGLKAGLSFGTAHWWGSTAVAISNILTAILMPIFGAYADASGRRKSNTILMGSICILLTGLIYLFQNIFVALALFIIANITYQLGNLFYDSMIPHIARDDDIGKVSAFGIAVGYGGSFVALALFYFVAIPIFGASTSPKDVVDGIVSLNDITLGEIQGMFLLSAVAFLLIMIPFFWAKERTPAPTTRAPFGTLISKSFQELKQTFNEIRRDRDMLIFIIGYFLISDGVNTVIFVMKDVAQNGLLMSNTEVTILLGIGIAAALVLVYPLGPLTDKRGPKFTIKIVGIGWIIAMILFLIAGIGPIPAQIMFAGAVLSGMCMGGTWVVGRQFVIELAPPDRLGQYFGFQKLSGKISASIGPIIFSLALNLGLNVLADIPASYKVGIFSLLIFFILGLVVLLQVTDYHEPFLSGNRAPYTELD